MAYVDEEVEKASKDMDTSEDALIASGFNEDQWMLIKQFISSTIQHSALLRAKDFIETNETLSNPK